MSATDEMLAESARDIEKLQDELEREVSHARHMAGLARFLFAQIDDHDRHVIMLPSGMISLDHIARGAFALDDVRETARKEFEL